MGTLYIVATPIGNLEDVSERAKATLASVDLILCEDTRVTGKLLSAIGVKTKKESYHQHSTEKKEKELIEKLADGMSMALVSDAGTPGISDPGGKLVAAAHEAEIPVVPIPGASAVIAALSVSGFATDKFSFLGFPPQKKGRAGYFAEVAENEGAVVFYESTHRIMKTLAQLGEAIGNREILVARELTKLHETLYRGTVEEVTESLKSTSIKGEFVVVIGPKK